MNVLIKSATIIDASQQKLHLTQRDILIKNGIIVKIAASIDAGNTRVISRENLHVSLGWFDSGVCFGAPGFEQRETLSHGLRTAAKSGFTDIVLGSNTYPAPDSSVHISSLKSSGLGKVTRLHPLGTLSAKGEGRELAELYDMTKAGAVGFYDFKHPIENANLFKIALQYASDFGALPFSFPMDATIAGKGNVGEGENSVRLGLKGIPALAEELRITRDLSILEYTGGKLHIPTISTAKSVSLIADAKKKGLDVSCSVAIANLKYTDETLAEFDAAYKVLPPLRTQNDCKALIAGVKAGTIDFVTSDHLPISIEEKQVEFENAAFGSIGLESAFGSLGTLFDLEETIELLTRGRDRFQIIQPALAEGKPANLSLFNPEFTYKFANKNILSTSKNSLFLGAQLKGKVYGAISNNMIQIDDAAEK